MALTEATHHRLHHRATEGQTQHSRGVYAIGEFSGFIRCLESTFNGALIWTGESDGSIAVRRGVSGDTVALLRGREGAFPTVIHAVRSHVWVGFSDGYINVHSPVEPFALFASAKGHTGAVTAITSHHGRVLTGGEDRLVRVWDAAAWDTQRPHDPATPSLRPLAKLVEARRAITSLAASGGTVFAGTLDGVVYAWDLAALVANTDVFPVKAHKGAVTALAARGASIITAGEDGAVRVISSQTGHTLRYIPAHRGPVVDLNVDDASGRIYTAGQDGDVHVFDAATGKAVATYSDARVSSVRALRGIGNVATTRLWVAAADGTVRVLSMDGATDGGVGPQGCDAMDARVDGLRAILQQTNSDIERQKALLEALQGAGGKRRAALARNLAVSIARGRAVDALNRMLSWYAQRRLRQRREILAAAMGRQHQLAAAGRAFRVWLMWWSKQHRSGGGSGDGAHMELLASHREAAAAANAFSAAREVEAERAAARFRARTANALAQRSTRAVLERYFATWSQFAVGPGRRNRMDARSSSLQQPALPRGALAEAFNRLASASRAHASEVHRHRLASSMAHGAEMQLTRRYFTSLLQFAMRRKRHRTLAHVVATAHSAHSATHRAADSELVARKAFSMWLRFRDLRALQRSERVIKAFEQREATLADHGTPPREEDIAAARAKADELDESIQGLEGAVVGEIKSRDVLYMVNFQLQQEANAAAAAAASVGASTPPPQGGMSARSGAGAGSDERSVTVLQLLMSLKARMLNLHEDFPIVKATIDAVAAHPKGRAAGAQARFWQAFDSIAAIAARHTTPENADDAYGGGNVWNATLLSTSKLTVAESKSVVRHTKELVCAWDVASPTVAQGLQSHAATVEAAPGLVELVSRAVETLAGVGTRSSTVHGSPTPAVGSARSRDRRPVWK